MPSGATAAAVEALEENRVCSQITGNFRGSSCQSPGSVSSPSLRSPSQATDLPNGGKYDHLLKPGRSVQLCAQFAHIFRRDPPVTCGSTNGRTAGLSCRYRDQYPRQVFSPDAIVQHMQLAKTFWDPFPPGNIIEVPVEKDARLIIVGDTHGQLEDVLWIFFKYGLPSVKNQYLFNGDIVDRGGHALEILLLLFAFKRDEPKSLHVLRGNHEDLHCCVQYGFKSELESKFPDHLSAVWDVCINVAFPLMPLVGLVSDSAGKHRYCVVHGGVPVSSPEFDGAVMLYGDLDRIDRQRNTVQVRDQDWQDWALFNFLWADPIDSELDYEEDARADQFTEDDTREFCESNKLTGLIRSHEVPESLRGVEVKHSGLCLTVFSASNYTGSCENRGGVLICRGEPLELMVSEHWAPLWPMLADVLPFSFEDSPAKRMRGIQAWESQFGIRLGLISVDRDKLGAIEVDPDDESLPSPSLSPSPSPCSPAEEQEMQFMAERVVEHKDELFVKLSAADTQSRGIVSRKAWSKVILEVLGPHCDELITPETVEELIEMWSLPDPVEYVRFLHRFQLRDDPNEGSILVDKIQAVSLLQRQLIDFSSCHLEKLLDPDGDHEVSRKEFCDFLPQFNVELPPWQAAALYETMGNIVSQRPITLDSTILCLALVSCDPPPVTEWTNMCESVGRELVSGGITFAAAFRRWDTDRSGFLSLAELEKGLRSLPATKSLSPEQIQACTKEIDSRGVENERVSIFEFVRAVAPRKMLLTLQRSMIREVLKKVWVCRPLLLAYLGDLDPDATNVVSVEDFRAGFRKVNAHLQRTGQTPLSAIQVGAVCEIAAAGGQEVRYSRFVRGLHVEDTCAKSVEKNRWPGATGSSEKPKAKEEEEDEEEEEEDDEGEEEEEEKDEEQEEEVKKREEERNKEQRPSAAGRFWETETVIRLKRLKEQLDEVKLLTFELRSVCREDA